jgi:RHS repeat-associated protein
MTDSIGTTAYDYDALNRLIKVNDPYSKVVEYTYDAAGRKSSIIYPGNHTATYEYDAAGQLRFARDWLGTETEFIYDNAGRLINQINGNGTVTYRYYDTASRLTSLVSTKSNTSTITSHSFTMDKVGNRTQLSEEVPLLPVFTNQSFTFNHNAGHQLVSDDLRTYAYDNKGNRTGSTEGATQITYTYNAMNRLTQVSDGVNTDSYVYNGDGDRIASVIGGVEKRYVLDISGDMANVLAETISSGQILRYFIHGNGLLYSIAASDNTKHYYHYDAIGNTLAITDDTEEVTDTYSYDSFGMSLGEVSSTENPFRYVGQFGVATEENGLLFMRARFYDPVTKRFMSKDPITLGIMQPKSLNPYPYADDNPIIKVDPEGKIVWFAPIIMGAVIGAGYQAIKNSDDLKAGEISEYLGKIGLGAIGGGIAGTASMLAVLGAPTLAVAGWGAATGAASYTLTTPEKELSIEGLVAAAATNALFAPLATFVPRESSVMLTLFQKGIPDYVLKKMKESGWSPYYLINYELQSCPFYVTGKK